MKYIRRQILNEKESIDTVYSNGDKEWRDKNFNLHRLDGPAFIHSGGDIEWFKHGIRHREDGPAVEKNNGYKFWYQNGYRHRLEGPAIEGTDIPDFWYLNGEEYTEEEFNNLPEVISHKLRKDLKGSLEQLGLDDLV